MKTQNKKVYIPNAGILFIIFIIGLVGAYFHLFAPLHEIWHAVFGIYEGALPSWKTTTYATDDINTISTYAGYFGEILSLAALTIYMLVKYHFKWATLFFGGAHNTAWYAWEGSDFLYVPHPGIVWIVYAATILTITWILYIYVVYRVKSLTKYRT